MRNIIKILATFFYIGYLPISRASFASAAALALYYLVKENILSYILMTLFLIVAGFFVSGKAEEMFGKKDSPQITIDDAAGMLIALFLIPQKPIYIIGAFLLYRLLDIIKPPPIRRLEKLKGASGVMLDDIAAGFYTNIILQTIRYTLYAIR